MSAALPPFANEPVLELRRAALAADPDGHAQRQAQLVESGSELRPLARAAQFEDRLVGEGGQACGHYAAVSGAASSCSSGTPCAWSARKLSLAVFSSSRRTR